MLSKGATEIAPESLLSAVLDMQVASANTTERNAHNGIARTLQFGLWLVYQRELAGGYVGVGFHYLCKRFSVLGRYYADFAFEELYRLTWNSSVFLFRRHVFNNNL